MGKKFWDRADSLLTERRIAIACGVLLAISLLPLAVISFYNHPCSDDYSYGLYVAQAVRAGGSLGGILAAAVRETAETYFDWQGTFSAVFLMALQPAAFGERFYAVTAYLMVGSLVFANFFFLKELCVHRLGMSRSSWVTISCALCFFMVHFAPSAFEGFFWYNGSLFYTFFHGLALCLFTFLSKFLRASSATRSLICGVVSAILAFIVGGGNYPSALLSCVVLFLVFLWTLWKRQALSRKLGTLCFFLLETAAFAISILAPGNSVRQAHFENRPGAVKAIVLALGATARNITQWTTLPVVLALLFLAPIFCKYAAKLSFRFPMPLLAVLGAVCLLGVLLTPPIYAMGGTGAARMDDLYYDVFCLLAAGVTFYLCGWFVHLPAGKQISKKTGISRAAVTGSLALLFCAAVITLPQFKTLSGVSALRSLLNGEAQSYHAQVSAQVTLLEDASLTDVVLEPVTYRPALLLPTSVPVLSEDPENAVNQRVATFYGKESVRVQNH